MWGAVPFDMFIQGAVGGPTQVRSFRYVRIREAAAPTTAPSSLITSLLSASVPKSQKVSSLTT